MKKTKFSLESEKYAKELRKALREAKELIKHIGWTSAEQPEVIQEADRWLESNGVK